MPESAGHDRGHTRTLLRGLGLLEAISAARDGATVTELAARSGLDKGTVSRLLATLRDAGWAHQAPGDRRYRLAGKALALSHDYTNRVDLRAVAMPLLARLRDRWQETVHLGQIEGEAVVYIERLAPDRAVQVFSIVGQRMPIGCTAMGRAYLAALPTAEARRILTDLPLPKRTPHTITARRRLLALINEAGTRGYAIDNQETDPDTICVGAAVTDVTGRPAGALSVSGPAYRMTPHLEQIGQTCHAAAASISAALGASSGAVDPAP